MSTINGFSFYKSKKCVKILNRIVLEENGLIGSTFYSTRSGKFIVEECVGRASDNRKLYRIRFLKTNETYEVRSREVLTGKIRDYMYPSDCGIGYLGREYLKIYEEDKELCVVLRGRWHNLIQKIYNPNNHDYKNYGKLGVTVDESWHCFSTFYRDITSLPEFNRETFFKDKLEIDKDTKQSHIPINERVYSKNTVALVPHSSNMTEVDYDRVAKKKSIHFVVIDKINNCEYLDKNIRKFAREHNISQSDIVKIIKHNKYNQKIVDYDFRYPTPEEQELIDKGLLSVGDKINDTKT